MEEQIEVPSSELSAEDVRLQTFTITKFRDGYDSEQVDTFLDQVHETLKGHEATIAKLNEEIASLTAKLEQEKELVSQESSSHQTSGASPDAQKSSAMLQMALELHDKYVHDGENQRDQLISEGEATAKRLVSEAETERADVLRLLSSERDDLKGTIRELRDFESEYRSTLRSYIESQLRGLEGSPEPAGAPNVD
ncbi:DivIVA domain-containing protein [Leucobacter sp. OH1287]|uniref:DivIVA domain-containing protein n=1 Tax=Leucobacter sp. OH1287 TaxID=2491049 RepID=UPI000F5DF65A|nr:DivIVA domain-containing protein [Leucobacter sp. OH1287]RRD60221.1 DivIVA domain-containing protein [Leucobacter sp. OH1287]